MTALELRPLVVVREHGGFASAFPAFAPGWVSYADDAESALFELCLFLGEHLARVDATQIPACVIPEAATLRRLSVLVGRDDLPRAERVKTPIELPVVELEAGEARWVLVPSLGHVAYVGRERASELEEVVRGEVQRLVHAQDLSGAAWLDLLPTETFELVRPRVEVEPRDDAGDAASRPERARRRKLKAATDLLDKIGRRMTAPIHPVLHRDLEPLRAVLGSRSRASAVLVGPPGSGKSALMRAAIAAMPGAPAVFATSGAELVAGQSFVGQLEERIESVMAAAELLDAVLYFEELDDLFAGRPGGYEDIAGLMQRWVEQGRVRIVGELSADEYDRLQHRHVGFFAYFTEVAVPALGKRETTDALRALAARSREVEEPALTDDAAPLVVDLCERYDPYRALPGKAVALLDELVAGRRAEPREDGSLEIGPDDVLSGMSTKTGVPEFLLRDERSMLLENVERFFRERLIGQEQAVRSVAETLCAVKAGLQPQSKPLAAFLFVGPTGVGKTELAKALARFLFGSTERMARFDMSEYADPWAAERLIRGTDRDDGVLTRKIREQPFSVILLDEIEKADPAVFDLLLQVLGEGRLSDARGKVAWFSNAIIIMTSNLGAQHQRSSLGFGDAPRDDSAHYLSVVGEHFRPEFVNRLDRIVCFYSLTRAQIHEVARLSVARIAQRDAFEHLGIALRVSEAALAKLAEEGYSGSYGARGLRRHLEYRLVAPAAGLIAGLGARARGALARVERDDEAEKSGLTERAGDELARAERGGLVFRMLDRPRSRTAASASGAIGVSQLRRELGRWIDLRPIVEIRERLAEIGVELALASGSKRQRKRAPQGALLGQLTHEHARLSALLAPLDSAMAELEQIEALVVAALYEESEPTLFESEAKEAHRRFKSSLVETLVARSGEDEITLAFHELDQARVLHRLLLPLLRRAAGEGWEVRLHLDRGPRTPEDAWPPVDQRRWGPPLGREQYLERFGAAEAERPFSNVLVRLRGPSAGALLSFTPGRWRYQSGDGYGEVWVRLVAPRFELDEKGWQSDAARAAIDVEVGRRQTLRLEIADTPERLTAQMGWVIDDLDEHQVFERWNEIVFDWVVAVIEAGGSFLPEEH